MGCQTRLLLDIHSYKKPPFQIPAYILDLKDTLAFGTTTAKLKCTKLFARLFVAILVRSTDLAKDRSVFQAKTVFCGNHFHCLYNA